MVLKEVEARRVAHQTVRKFAPRLVAELHLVTSQHHDVVVDRQNSTRFNLWKKGFASLKITRKKHFCDQRGHSPVQGVGQTIFVYDDFFFNDTKPVPKIRFFRDELLNQTLFYRNVEGLNFLNLLFERSRETESDCKPIRMSNRTLRPEVLIFTSGLRNSPEKYFKEVQSFSYTLQKSFDR